MKEMFCQQLGVGSNPGLISLRISERRIGEVIAQLNDECLA
jgi:hypothetical protein